MQLKDLPPLRTFPKTIEASCYNRVRLALLRLGCPLQVEIPDLCLDTLLDRKSWIVLPFWQQNMPLLAWTEFENKERSSIHGPVRCQLHLYHVQAGLLMGTTLDHLDRQLSRRLSHA